MFFDLPFQNAIRFWFLLWWLFNLKGLTPPEKVIFQVCYQKFWEISQERHQVSLDFYENRANFEIYPFFHYETCLFFIILNSTLCQPFFIFIKRKILHFSYWSLENIWSNGIWLFSGTFDPFLKDWKGLVILLQYTVGLELCTFSFELSYVQIWVKSIELLHFFPGGGDSHHHPVLARISNVSLIRVKLKVWVFGLWKFH